MAISCDCDPVGIFSVGDPREIKCKTKRDCYSCRDEIRPGMAMYIQSMYDFELSLTAAPIFICEECGDMVLNLTALNFCFSFGESIKDQWLEYLYDYEPNNPAVRNMK